MTVSLKHQFVSNVADSPDATLVQPSNWNAEHTLTANANSLLGAVTAGNVTEITCTSAGRALLDDADASAQRTTLGLGTISTQNSNNVSITGGSVTGITDIAVADGGTGASDAPTARTNLGIGTIATQNANNVSITGGSISGITDLAVADGGTGASDATTARTNLGLGTISTQNANNVSITGGSITGITDLAVADGGTGASDAATARTNLGIGTIATQNANNVSITGGSITGITDLAVADGGTGASTAAGAATNLGLGTGDSPQFAAVNIGNATDTTITRVSAGVIAVEGKTVVTETGGQTVQFAAGSNTAPSITTTGDTNTGIYFPAADTIAFTEGGTEAMRIDSSGNLGIGTNTPSSYDAKLAVFNGNLALTSTTNKLYLYYVSSTNYAHVSTATDGSITFTNGTTSPAERMRIDNSGKVGIGTSSPVSKLTISGSQPQFSYVDTGASGPTWYIGVGAGTGDSQNFAHYTSSSTAFLTFWTNNSERMRINASGQMIVQGLASQTNSSLAINPSTDATSERAAITTGDWSFGQDFSYNGTKNFYIYTTQNSGKSFVISTTGTLQSQPTYDNTATGSTVVVTSAGDIRRTSSSIKYKKDIEDLDSALADNAIANLRPVWYRTKNAEGDDKAEWSHIGLIAEEVDQVEKRLVKYRTVEITSYENNQRVETLLSTPEPEDVDYARLAVLLLDKVQRMDKTLQELKADFDAYKSTHP